MDFWGRQIRNGEPAFHGFFPFIVPFPFTECAIIVHGLKKAQSFIITNANLPQTFKFLQNYYSTT